MNIIEWNHQKGKSDHSEKSLQSNSEKSWDIVLGKILLFVHHLNCDNNLSHDNEQISSDDGIFIIEWVAIVVYVSDSNNHKSEHNEEHAEPFEWFDLCVEHTNGKKTGEDDNSSTKHLET